jgi:hypothetical protein
MSSITTRKPFTDDREKVTVDVGVDGWPLSTAREN